MNRQNLNKGDKPCEKVMDNGQPCQGHWRTRYLKEGDVRGLCKKCNKLERLRREGLYQDASRNMIYDCRDCEKKALRLVKGKP